MNIMMLFTIILFKSIMLITIIILYTSSFWKIGSRTKPGGTFASWLKAMYQPDSLPEGDLWGLSLGLDLLPSTWCSGFRAMSLAFVLCAETLVWKYWLLIYHDLKHGKIMSLKKMLYFFKMTKVTKLRSGWVNRTV